VVNFGAPAAQLLQASREKENQLFVRQTLERSNREIHRDLVAVVALEGDGDARGFQPSIRKAPWPRRLECTPIKPSSIRKTTH
jgi:hypothetical protein